MPIVCAISHEPVESGLAARRIAEPADLAALTVILCEAQADFTNGRMIACNEGAATCCGTGATAWSAR